MELRKTQQRLKLLEQARGLDWRSRYFPLCIFAVFFILIALFYFNFFHIQEKPAILFLPTGVALVFTLFFYLSRTNRRLDALLELLDFDQPQPENRSRSNDEKAG